MKKIKMSIKSFILSFIILNVTLVTAHAADTFGYKLNGGVVGNYYCKDISSYWQSIYGDGFYFWYNTNTPINFNRTYDFLYNVSNSIWKGCKSTFYSRCK